MRLYNPIVASRNELKDIARARLRSARFLMDKGDWDGAAYMMGYVLELGLKAIICKIHHFSDYPDRSRGKIEELFKTHDFDTLNKLSGMEYIFNIQGNREIWQNWSDFTSEYPGGGQWVEIRYTIGGWDRMKVERMFNNLVSKPHGIIETIKRRW